MISGHNSVVPAAPTFIFTRCFMSGRSKLFAKEAKKYRHFGSWKIGIFSKGNDRDKKGSGNDGFLTFIHLRGF